MAKPATEHRFASFDGQEIAWHELGAGHPVVLLHGLFSHAEMNWLRWGAAQSVADAGFRVVLPDLRAHGKSAAPHDPAAYPTDVLALDIEALTAHLGLTKFDLGGYSLGARSTMRLLVRGMQPRRAVLAGMGLEGLIGSDERRNFFLDAIANRSTAKQGSDAWMAAQFMKSTGTDPDAVAHVLRSQVQTTADDLSAMMTETLVVCGADDRDNGSAPDLARALPNARYVEIPGNHMSAVTKADLGREIAAFLTA